MTVYYQYPTAQPLTGTEIIGPVRQGNSDVIIRTSSFLPFVNARTYGAVGNGVTDDTVALQAAMTAAAGSMLFVPAGTYVMSKPVYVSSNTVVFGEGQATLFEASTSYQPDVSGRTVLFSNYHSIPANGWTGFNTFTADVNITFRDLAFNTNLPTTVQGFTTITGIVFINTTNCRSLFLNSTGGGQQTYYAHTDQGLIMGCNHIGAGNACWDHSAGPINHTIVGCYGTVATNAATTCVIQFNAGDGSNTDTRVAGPLVIEGCTCYGSISLTTLGSNCSLEYARISGNYVNTNFGAGGQGIGGAGAILHSKISNNIVVTPGAYGAISLTPGSYSGNFTGNPDYNTIDSNTVLFTSATAPNGQPMLIKGTNNVISGNTTAGIYSAALNLIDGSSYGGDNNWAAGTVTTVIGNIIAGSPQSYANGQAVNWLNNSAGIGLSISVDPSNLAHITVNSGSTYPAQVATITTGTTTPTMTFYNGVFFQGAVGSLLNYYANDAAAAAGGVPIRGWYIQSGTGSVQSRIS